MGGIFIKNIIVVDCISSGVNYIGDIINRGYNPIVLELKPPEDDVEEYKATTNAAYDCIDDKFDMIFERDTYEETLEVVRKHNPELIVPGNEHGVVLANRLSSDLGLLCNPIENLDALTLKDKMQEKIAEAGLRHIKGKVVHSLEEAIEFYEAESLKEVVVKPTYSAASVGVSICSDKEEMIDAINDLLNSTNYYGEHVDEIIVQERINGTEYIVDTASHDGVHLITLIWKYTKVETSDGDILYDTMETVNELGIGECEMVEYAYKVADALGVKYGPVHGEYMLDEKGPILIEVNCRPLGCSMPARFLDRIAGHHETDIFLDSYLKPNRFFERRKERYRLYAHGALKLFMVPEDIVAKSAPMNQISPRLKSYYGSNIIDIKDTEVFYVKTQDLETSCGFVYMVHEDEGVLKRDIDFLRSVETNAFSMVLSDESIDDDTIDEEKIIEDIRDIIDAADDYGTGLLISDQFIEGIDILQVAPEDVNKLNGEFDYVIINLNKTIIDKKNDIAISIILNILSNIKVGGTVCIPKSTYKYIPNKRNGIEALLMALNLRIEVPPHGLDIGVIATRDAY